MLPLIDVPTIPFRARPLESSQDRAERAAQARRGARNRHTETGHAIGYTEDPSSGGIHMTGSLLAQLGSGEGLDEGIRRENIRYKKIAGRGRRNLIFLVDTSGSMLTEDRLAMVKGCVVSLLEDAYVKRTRVALIGFGGAKARLILPFTSSAEMAAVRIGAMRGGGTTPLLEALGLAVPLIESAAGEPTEILLLSDGRYNQSRTYSARIRVRDFGSYCRKQKVQIRLIDAGPGGKTGRARAEALAGLLKAEYRRLTDLRAEDLMEAVQEKSGASGPDAPG